jgi:hypothetical protein
MLFWSSEKKMNLPRKGEKFKVVEPPPVMPTINGKVKGLFHKGEIVEYDYYTYNSYDGFPMFFFKERSDGREAVWIGDYNDSQETMLARWTEYFEKV